MRTVVFRLICVRKIHYSFTIAVGIVCSFFQFLCEHFPNNSIHFTFMCKTLRYGTVLNGAFFGLQDKSPREGGTTDRGRLVCNQETSVFLA